MATSRKSTTKKKCAPPASKVLDSITGSDALLILRYLAERDDKFAELIDTIAREHLGQADFKEVAADVQMTLELLDVEEVWDRAGSKRDGYVDPGDAAWEMFAESLVPFEDTIEKYQKLSMFLEARACSEGILKGIYDFYNDSTSEYKDWALDAPAEFFSQVLGKWRNLFKGRPPLSEIEEFLHSHCPDWVERGMRELHEGRQ